MSPESGRPARDWQALCDERARAVRTVAAAATDPTECAMLLDMLGLRAKEGVKDGGPAADYRAS
ncbi:MAG: hypothetical protein ACJ72N_09190 [Labedaea sp.]